MYGESATYIHMTENGFPAAGAETRIFGGVAEGHVAIAIF